MERTRSSIPPLERYMQQFSLGVSVLVSLLRSAFNSLVTFLGPSWDGQSGNTARSDICVVPDRNGAKSIKAA
jgi:hypothetical protein